MHVLICGGGLAGAATAYFLGRRGAAVTVVERRGLACAASGKGGGFLAAGWCDGTAVGPLARRSFALHARLAAELDDDCGYRRLDSYGGSIDPGRRGQGGRAARGWLGEAVSLDGQLGSTADTAQVHPGRLAAALMRAAERAGARLRIGEVTDLLRERPGADVRGALVDGEALGADATVIAMGPWSRLARRWLPRLPPVYALKGHSLLFETGDALPPEAVFLECRDGERCSPEIFPRPDGTTYIAAINSEAPLPADPADVGPDPGALERLHLIAAAASPVLAGSPVVARQSCYRPITADGLPVIGAVPGAPGAYVAAGHGVWGILNAPATGEALAGLILDGRAASVPLGAFDPARFAR